MQNSRIRLGELLIEARIITREQLDTILAMQRSDPRRLGTLLVESGLTTEIQVTQILSQQLSVPWVSLYHVDFSRQLLDLVPEHLAEQHCLVPIFVRRVRGHGNTLYVAMDDPSDDAALQAVQQYAGIPVRAMIAPPSDIREAIQAYYGAGVGLTPSMAPAAKRAAAARARPTAPETEGSCEGDASAPLSGTSVGNDQKKPKSAEPSRIAGMGANQSALSQGSTGTPVQRDQSAAPSGSMAPESDSSPLIDAREIGMPRPKKGAPRRMVTLMLLDGSQVTLPARRPRLRNVSEPPQSAADNLTARDILQALRAKLHGQDPSEVLGDHGRWEALFSALISVLLKKHLVADWEFIDALKRL
jgi:type IV pilus assembly protein PilB